MNHDLNSINVILEIEHHGTGSKALLGFSNMEEADRKLKEKGFIRVTPQDFVWCGLTAEGEEVSVMFPSVCTIDNLKPVFQKKKENEHEPARP